MASWLALIPGRYKLWGLAALAFFLALLGLRWSWVATYAAQAAARADRQRLDHVLRAKEIADEVSSLDDHGRRNRAYRFVRKAR